MSGTYSCQRMMYTGCGHCHQDLIFMASIHFLYGGPRPAAGLTPLMLFYTSLLSIAFESSEAIDDSVQLDEIEC
jgi:hypothetical protein